MTLETDERIHDGRSEGEPWLADQPHNVVSIHAAALHHQRKLFMTIKGGSTIDQSSVERRNLGTTPKSSRESCAAMSAGIEPVGLVHRSLRAAAVRASIKRRSGAVSGLR